MSKYAGLAQDVLNLYRATPPETRGMVRPLLIELKDQILSDVLVDAGMARKGAEGPGKHVWRNKLLYCSAQEPDHMRYCEAELKTRSLSGCRNRPMIGGEHCRQHSSPEEIALAVARQDDWRVFLDDLTIEAGHGQLIHEVLLALGGDA